jgi:hypothetical protein
MTDKMNLSSFLNLFDTPTDGLDYILKADLDGKVEVTEYIIPFYSCTKYNPPRFVQHAEYEPQTHSYEVAITGLSLTMVIEFPMGDSGVIDWFAKNLHFALSDGFSCFEKEEVNISDPTDLKCTALALQHEINLNRIFDIRAYMFENGAGMNDDVFASNCYAIVQLTDTNKAIAETLATINMVA